MLFSKYAEYITEMGKIRDINRLWHTVEVTSRNNGAGCI